MPVVDEAIYSGRRAPTTSQIQLPNGVESSPLLDLLDLTADDEPAPANSSAANFLQDLLGTSTRQKSGTLDLLSTPAQNGSSTAAADILSITQDDNKSIISGLDSLSKEEPPAAVVAFESTSLTLTFNFSKQPGSPQTTLIQATFTNKSSQVYTDFIFQAAVPKFLQLHLEPASSNTLPENGNGSITQNLRLTNNQHGKKSLISYKLNNKDMLEQGQISNFPPS